jgi:MFS family permease
MSSEDPAVNVVPYAGALRRDVNLLAIFRGVSFFGDALALVALYLRVAPRGHAWGVAALGVASALPLVLFAPIAGLVVDRVRAKPLLIALGAGETLVCAGLGYWHSVPATIALLFALNAVVAFSMPGYSALIVAITGTEHVTRAQGVLQGTQGAASVLGPVFGGLLVGATGQSWPLYLDALTFALGTVGTMLIAHDRRPDPSTRGGVREDMLAGLLLIARDALLRPVTLNVCCFLLALGTINVAEVFYVTVTFHGSALAYGGIGATFGLGTIAGALYASRWKKSEGFLTRALGGSIVLVGLFVTVVGFVANVVEIYPLMILTGVAVGVANVAATTLFALRSPEAVRGRVFAALNAGTTTAQIGATVIGGAVLAVMAPRSVYRFGGGLATLSALVFGYLALRALRRHTSTLQGD